MTATRRILQAVFCLALFLENAQAVIKNPDTFLLATYGTVQTLDPAGWVAEGIGTGERTERSRIYAELQDLWYEEALGIPLYQQLNMRVYRDWVKGYVPNAMLPDAWENLKRLRKEAP